MSANDVVAAGGQRAPGEGRALAARLERGEVLFYPAAPFPLPAGSDLKFLLGQELGSLAHKNISYNPATGKVAGFVRTDAGQPERLRRIFADFSAEVTAWLGRASPYASGWDLDRCSFRPEEEATRRLRQTARNDLLHVDAFPGRPSQGRRILRVFANINPREPRIWVTSDPFARLLERFGERAGLPGAAAGGWLRNFRLGLVRLFHPKQSGRSDYDAFMLRFHDYLKANDEFQERGPKRLWTFPPFSVWLAMTDTCSHAVLRGRFALEHSYFIKPEVLVLPAESPAVLLAMACRTSREKRAA
jgi:hypothetical protein